MNTILKYIFYFILGIIISLFLNKDKYKDKDLVEGWDCNISGSSVGVISGSSAGVCYIPGAVADSPASRWPYAPLYMNGQKEERCARKIHGLWAQLPRKFIPDRRDVSSSVLGPVGMCIFGGIKGDSTNLKECMEDEDGVFLPSEDGVIHSEEWRVSTIDYDFSDDSALPNSSRAHNKNIIYPVGNSAVFTENASGSSYYMTNASGKLGCAVCEPCPEGKGKPYGGCKIDINESCRECVENEYSSSNGFEDCKPLPEFSVAVTSSNGNINFECKAEKYKMRNGSGTECVDKDHSKCGVGRTYIYKQEFDTQTDEQGVGFNASGCSRCPHGKKPNTLHNGSCVDCKANEAGILGLCGSCPPHFQGRGRAAAGAPIPGYEESLGNYQGGERICSPSCISHEDDGVNVSNVKKNLNILTITEHDLAKENFHVDVECLPGHIKFFNAQPCKNQPSSKLKPFLYDGSIEWPIDNPVPGPTLDDLSTLNSYLPDNDKKYGIKWMDTDTASDSESIHFKKYTLPSCYDKRIFNDNNTCGEISEVIYLADQAPGGDQSPLMENVKNSMRNQCSELNKTLLENKKCTLSQCVSPDYCCSIDTPDSVEDLFNEILSTDTYYDTEYININHYLNDIQTSHTDEDKIQTIQLNANIIKNIKDNFGSEDLFTKNWIGVGGGQEEMASDIWKRLINRINNINGNNDLTDLTNMTEDDLKIMLINLDKPIKDATASFVYPTPYGGLSPLDIFLYNTLNIPPTGTDQGINAAQLEALL